MKIFYLTIIILLTTLFLYGQPPIPILMPIEEASESEPFLPCTALPRNVTDPEGALGINTPRDRLWEVGQTITVRFFGGDRELRNKIRGVANEWQRYANIKFEFVEDGVADIRIGFVPTINNSSQIGNEALLVGDGRNTMNFSLTNEATEDYQLWVIRHEFGHALGLLHEHVHPRNNIPWDREAVYNYQSGLTRAEVDQIFFNLPAEDAVYFCDYDRYSVMHYQIGNESTIGDFYTEGYNVISEEDKRFIGKLYPFNGNRNPQEFCSNVDTDTDTNVERALSVRVNGEGSVAITSTAGQRTCTTTCNYIYEEGTIIQIEAIPQSNHRFVRWGGTYCTDSTQPNCQFSLNTDGAIIAIFEPVEEEETCLAFTVTPINSRCNDGMVDIAITKGVAPFYVSIICAGTSNEKKYYERNLTLESLGGGDYTINIRDKKGCTATQTFTINSCFNTTNTISSSRSAGIFTGESVEETTIKNDVSIAVGSVTPNPFRNYTKLPFTLAKDGAVSLEIFYSNGQRVYESTQVFEAGRHQIALGEEILPKSGLYIYHFRVADQLVTGKMIRL